MMLPGTRCNHITGRNTPTGWPTTCGQLAWDIHPDGIALCHKHYQQREQVAS